MSKRIKQLTETRGAKLKEARSIVEAAQKEERELSADELTKLDGLYSEAESTARTIQAEARQLAEEGRKLDLNFTEQREIEQKFSLARMLGALSEGRPLDGMEAEMAAEGQKEARESGISSKGIIVPQWAIRLATRRSEQRDLTATGGTSLNQGGMTIETDKAGLLDDLFNRSVLGRAGATFLPGLTGNIDIPRLVKGTAPAGKAENAQAAEYTATTAQLSLSPNRLPTVIEVSNQLMRQSGERALQTIVMRHLESFLNQQMQIKLLHGSGTNEPTGVASTSGIGSVVGGTNGAAPDYGDMVKLQREVAVDDADIGNEYYLINAKTEAKLKMTAKLATTDSLTVIDGRAPGQIDGKPYLLTNSVSSALTKGSSSGVCSAIFYGAWRDLWVGQWGGIEFLVNPYSKDDYGLTRINAAVYYDGGLVRPVSISAMLDALTTIS
jgi:HK97 family phage major capsid protein